MDINRLQVKQKVDESSDVSSFYFDVSDFNYYPGQFVQLFLDIKNCDLRCNVRNYSIASSPTETEKNNQIMVTTKFAKANGSVFKKHLAKLGKGAEVKFRGPFGRFSIDLENNIPVVMLAGGIGITPFRSMIKFSTDKNLDLPIFLFYSNRTLKDIVFKNQFDQMAKDNKNLKIIYTVTDQQPPNWDGELARIDKQMIKKYLDNPITYRYYVCGPIALVDAMIGTLKELNVPEENIHFEKFTGY